MAVATDDYGYVPHSADGQHDNTITAIYGGKAKPLVTMIAWLNY
jgi:hypothetical protein